MSSPYVGEIRQFAGTYDTEVVAEQYMKLAIGELLEKVKK